MIAPAWEACTHCLVLAILFVGSLYVWNLFPSLRYTSRDDPYAIKCRMISVAVVSVIAPCYVYVVSRFSYIPVGMISLPDLVNCVIALGLTMIWFAGPLLQWHYDITGHYWQKILFRSMSKSNKGEEAQPSEPQVPQWKWTWTFVAYKEEISAAVASFRSEITPWRNVVVAPWGEEWVFRAMMIPLLILGGFQPFWAGFIAPLFFGVAHGHHAFQFIVHDKVPVARVLLSVTFQFLYTTLFGWYSAYLFIQTNSVLPPTIAHCFCNSMGFPDFGSIPSSPKKIQLSIVYVLGLGTYLTILFLNPSWLFWK